LDIDRVGEFVGFSANREAAHLAFDASLVAAKASGWEAFVEDFDEYSVMPC
jgi:hypothetical protein